MSERPADVIVAAIKENMILRNELTVRIRETRAELHDLEDQLVARDGRAQLLETNLKRALIQEIESEAA